MENNVRENRNAQALDFKGKVDAILAAKGITLNKLCHITGMGTTLEKAYGDNREMRPAQTYKFLERAGVALRWYENGGGEMFSANSGELPSIATGADAQRLIDKGGEYVYLHRRAFDSLEETVTQGRAIIERVTALNSEVTREYLDIVRRYEAALILLRGAQGPAKQQELSKPGKVSK